LIGGTRPGGFAELVSVPLRCVHPVSEQLSPEAAVFCEPLATCVHALRLAPDSLVEVAVVLGAGTIGVLAVQLLELAGAGAIVVTEVDEDRRRRVASEVVIAVAPDELAESVHELTGGRGASLSVDAVGSASTRDESLRVLESGGTAVWLGMHEQDSTVRAFDMVVREQRVQGSFAYTNPEFGHALALLQSRRFEPRPSRESIPLAQSGRAFQDLLDGAAGALKVIVRPGL
jgi:threonine dehydrogenase-like Zn-dependent dehydrogenase